MTDQLLQKVDHSALKTNQVAIIVLSLIGFVFDLPALVIFVAVGMGAGVVSKKPAFGFIYQYILKSRGWLKPDILDDHPEPHRFSQALGCLFLAGASGALFSGAAVLGWALVWLVIALASLNAFAGFCAGCAMYYWLARLGAPGFRKLPPQGLVPGMKPKAGAPA